MQDTTILKALREVEKDFASKKASLERDLKKKTQQVLDKMMTDFKRKVSEATIHLKLIPKRYRANIGQQAVVKQFLKQLSVTGGTTVVAPKTRKAKTTKRAPKVSEEQILEFLATDRKADEIRKHFGWGSAPTFNKYITPLVDAGKISDSKTRPKIYKKL